MRVVSRDLLYPSPGPGQLIYGVSYYTQARGVEKIAWRSVETKSDLIDEVQERRSLDNGRNWSEPTPRLTMEKTVGGTLRRFPVPGWIDPVNGRLLSLYIEGLLPKDDGLEGMTRYYLRYRTSDDGGRTALAEDTAIQRGAYDAAHPFDGVWIGKNSIFLGDMGSTPIRSQQGRVLVPVQITPLGPDGKYYNPGGGYTYHDAVLLIGEWQPDGRIVWDLSQYVRNDPAVSTRGCVEPTIAQVPDGRILMVLRGSNDAKPHLPGYRWFTVSHDQGWTWEPVKPWTYDDGTPFFSPSSMSQLLWHSSGRLLWLGNISPSNPAGNGPRYPLVIGEVDPRTLRLIRGSVTAIDDRGPDEDPQMTLSNFYAYEDRVSHEILLHMSRWMVSTWFGNAYLYRIDASA